MASTDATPLPIKNQAYRITFPIFDADGDLVTGATALDSEVSKDGGTFADCTNEATEIATASGMYYLDLTSTEMNADTVAVIVKTSSVGAKTTPIVMYPAENTDIPVNVTALGGVAQSATDLKDFADDGYDPATNKVQGVVLTDTLTTYTGNTPQTGDSFARIGATGSGLTTLATQATATAIETDTQDIQARIPAALTADGNIKADALRIGGTTQTGRDIGASVLLSSGTGTGQLDFTSGVVKSNLAQILGTALTETAGLLAAGFKKFFNVATPTGTVNSLPDAVAGAAGGVFIAGSNAATTANITGNITGNLSGSVGSVTGAVGSVTGNVGGNVVGSVASVTAGVTLAASAIQAIWDALTSALTTVGSIGKLIVDNLNATVSSRATPAQVNTEVVDALTIDTIADSYSADGEQPTIAQAILAIQQFLTEKSVTSTTVTVKKPNGSTTAFTLTLDSATTPTSITRAT